VASKIFDFKTRIEQVMNLLQPEIAARREARQKLNLVNDQEAGFILINQQMQF